MKHNGALTLREKHNLTWKYVITFDFYTGRVLEKRIQLLFDVMSLSEQLIWYIGCNYDDELNEKYTACLYFDESQFYKRLSVEFFSTQWKIYWTCYDFQY
jgi:hypothetical protein